MSESGNSNLENVTQISPYLGGLGLASGAVAFNVACYYNTIIAWCLRYLMQVRFAVDYDYDGLGGCNIDNDGYDGDDNGDDDGDRGDDDGGDSGSMVLWRLWRGKNRRLGGIAGSGLSLAKIVR